MGGQASLQNILKELRAHGERSGDDALLDLVVEMETRLSRKSQSISVGSITKSTAVAIGNGIRLVVNQSNLPETLVKQLQTLLEDLEKHRNKKKEESIWVRGKSPFPGLIAFSEDYARVFFGRNAETEQLLTRLSKPDCHFLMVAGASGSGKSSLVRAGLIPRLRQGELLGSERWPIVSFTPDAKGKGDPLEVLAWALSQPPLRLNIRTVRSTLGKSCSGLRHLLEEYLQKRSKHAHVLLFIDQFEELFSSVRDMALARDFYLQINEAAASSRIIIVATIRDDFLHYCAKLPILSRLTNRNRDSVYFLSAPGPLELYEMITAPAQAASLEYESSLAQRILKDTGSDPGALALMAFALDQLFKASGRDGKLTLDAYDSFRGVQGAIGLRAQETFETLSEAAKKTFQRVFSELLDVNESGVATRKRTPLEQLERDTASRELIKTLVGARLLTSSQGLVEVAHEALFRSWGNLKAWIEEAQDDLILLRQVRTAAEWWNKYGRKPEYLWLDERLMPVYEMQKRLEPNWNEHEKEFIRLEVERLWEEIENPATTHRRRSWIGERLDTLGDPRPGVGLVRTTLPLRAEDGAKGIAALQAGEIRMWGDKPEHIGLPDMVWLKVKGGSIQINQQTFKVEPFYIAKYPITYAQFKAFVEAKDGFKDTHWWEGLSANKDHKSKPSEQNFKFFNHPRENISWYDAVAFCRWLNARFNWSALPTKLNSKSLGTLTGLRLPTEWEWQWAATGGNKEYEYPWGKDWDGNKTNTSECGLARTTAVGMYLAGAAGCGASDMSGNIFEWCLNEYNNPEKIELRGDAIRVVRGGSWLLSQVDARAPYRNHSYPFNRYSNNGFRLVVRPPSLTESLDTESLEN